jgi:hypothetical protein
MSDDRRKQARPEPDRRRPGWHGFRQAYPGFVTVMAIAFAIMVLVDGWLIYRRFAYSQEISRLRARMTSSERQKTDLIVRSEENKVRIELALARLQMDLDTDLHLAVSVDSGRMTLSRDGATLREMPVEFSSDTAKPAPGVIPAGTPRGQRTIIAVRDAAPMMVELDGGTRIYASKTAGDTADTTAVEPGQVRARASDLAAILPNLSPGMKVYFY